MCDPLPENRPDAASAYSHWIALTKPDVDTIKTDAPEKELAKMYQYSPVYSMVSAAVPIEVKFAKM